MKIHSEISLTSFQFWAGGKDNADRFTYEELETLEYMLEDIYGEDGIDETMLNDIFWFEPETLCEWLDIDFEEWVERD